MTIKYVQLIEDQLEDALNVMRRSFFVDETISIAVEMAKNPRAQRELETLCKIAADDGLSYVAIDLTTKTVVGVAFNKIQTSVSDTETTYFQRFAATCKEPSSVSLVKFMDAVDTECDLFALCGIDCILELMFLAVLPEYRRRGIGNELTHLTIEAAKTLNAGINCKRTLNDKAPPLSIDPVPKGISSIFTSSISQKIGRKFGFNVAKRISYDEFEYDGKKFSERIGSDATPFTTVEYLLI